MHDLNTLAWPVAQLGEALEALARQSGLAPSGRETPVPPTRLAQDDAAALGAWIETAAAWLGLDAEPVEAPYAEVERSCALPARPCCACRTRGSRASWCSSVDGGGPWPCSAPTSSCTSYARRLSALPCAAGSKPR